MGHPMAIYLDPKSIRYYLWVLVNTRHQANTNRPPHGLGHAPLISRTETCYVGVFYTAHVCDELGHEFQVLFTPASLAYTPFRTR
jgi:hypothetical protein